MGVETSKKDVFGHFLITVGTKPGVLKFQKCLKLKLVIPPFDPNKPKFNQIHTYCKENDEWSMDECFMNEWTNITPFGINPSLY